MIVKDQQRHPVRGQVVHVDLLEVRLDEKIQATVALELRGRGGARRHRGRRARQPTHEAEHRGAADGHPRGDHRRRVAPRGRRPRCTSPRSRRPTASRSSTTPEETIIATVTVPTEVEEPEIEEETELVGEDGEPIEAAEGEEGEAAAEGESGESGESGDDDES